MGKKFAMSTLGYGIVLVIILGIVMIISAPMMADKYKNNKQNSFKQNISDDNESYRDEHDKYNNSASAVPVKSENREDYINMTDEIRNIERRMSVRIDNLEMRVRDMQNNQNNRNSVTNKYVCTIEGSLDENNNVVPLDAQNSTDIKSQKFVFVCEYRE